MSIDVGVGQLVEEIEQRGDRLPFEIGAFVALEVCEGLLKQAVKVEPDDVRVTAEGSVVVASSAERSEPDEAARALVSVLSRLLIAAGPGVPPYLLQLVRESATGQSQRDLRHLHDAIEASLIPLNRGASRRVLARLVRESDRPSAPQNETIDPDELDAELDELLRDPASRSLDVEPTGRRTDPEPVTARITIPRGARESEAETERTQEAPAQAGGESAVVSEHVKAKSAPPPSSVAVAAATSQDPSPEPEDETVTATIRVRFPDEEPRTAKVPIEQGPPADVAPREPQTTDAPRPVSEARLQSVTATTQQWAIEPTAGEQSSAGPSATDEVPDRNATPPASATPASPSKARAKRASVWPWLIALGVGGAVVALATSGLLDRVADRVAPSPEAAVAPPAARTGLVEIRVNPADAQVFAFVGRGPARAEGLTVGSPHEFVVFDAGLEPSRAVVPEGAIWPAASDGPLYELAVQARPASPSPESPGLGDPVTAPAAQGEDIGTIRIITNPPGAKVYRFVGLGPEVSIAVESIDEGLEILVYHPQHGMRREVIGPSDWQAAAQPGDDHRAELEVLLAPAASPEAPNPSDD